QCRRCPAAVAETIAVIALGPTTREATASRRTGPWSASGARRPADTRAKHTARRTAKGVARLPRPRGRGCTVEAAIAAGDGARVPVRRLRGEDGETCAIAPEST